MKIKLIVAVSENGVIGNKGSIPWSIKEEMRHFKKTTMGHVVVMGYKTWESLLPFNKKGYLDGRVNLVLTRTAEKIPPVIREYGNDNPNLSFYYNMFDMSHLIANVNVIGSDKDVFIIGGAEIYDLFLKKDNVDEIILSRVKRTVRGETKFPDIDDSKWTLLSVESRTDFDILHYQRNRQ